MTVFEPSFLLALAAAACISLAAWRLGALAPGGAVAATAIGGLTVIAAGWWTGVLLVTFFVTGSALSRARKTGHGEQQHRGSRRDAVQVLANGGVPCLLALASAVPADPEPWLIACAVSIAAATSDTWATEIGRFTRATPRRLFTWRRVPAGTSGAVSLTGTTGGFTGSAFIAVLAWGGAAAGWWEPVDPGGPLLITVALAGFAGCLIDSALGATVQAINWCPSCGRATEQAIHRCGTVTVPDGGIRWMNNDAVNLVSVALAALAGLFAAGWWL